jgi:hypothetical protein
LKTRSKRFVGHPGVHAARWRKRSACVLSNGVIELIALNGGGHVASLRFLPRSGSPDANVLWEAPWETADPATAKAKKLASKYGPRFVGEFLASFAGHALCLDYFGAPSADEVKQGLALHGEAATAIWRLVKSAEGSATPRAKWQVKLSSAGLLFEREIRMHRKSSVALFKESVTNQRSEDHYFHWVQHVTLGTPLLDPRSSAVFLSGRRAKTWPLGYEGKSLVASDHEFTWPHAPHEKGGRTDLSRPFPVRGTGAVACVLLDPAREFSFIAALNWELGLVSGYFFRREDFPWVAVWEENCARGYPPWNGVTRARGMEFGTTPMPIGKQAIFRMGDLFATPGWKCLPARGKSNVSYLAFLAAVPKSWRSIRKVKLEKNSLLVLGSKRGDVVKLGAPSFQELCW